jgi:hypothetical protein
MDNNKKKVKSLLIIIICLTCIISIGSIFSYVKTGVKNPFSMGVALIQIMFTNIEYITVNNHPQIIIAKSEKAEDKLVQYIISNGYIEDKNERMGALLSFRNEIKKSYVLFSSNAYFSLWRWQE